MDALDWAMRRVLAQLELTPATRAASLAPAVAHGAPGSQPPAGERGPADRWRDAYHAAAEHGARRRVLAGAKAELAGIRRRRFPLRHVHDGEDLVARVVADGEGLDPQHVALALRCTPTMVRRARLTNGRDAERGRVVRPPPGRDPAALVAAGLSIRQAAAVSGVPRSTLHDRLRA